MQSLKPPHLHINTGLISRNQFRFASHQRRWKIPYLKLFLLHGICLGEKAIFIPERQYLYQKKVSNYLCKAQIYCHCRAEDQTKLFMCKRSLSALQDEEWSFQKINQSWHASLPLIISYSEDQSTRLYTGIMLERKHLH